MSVSPHIAFSGCSRCHIMYTENLPQSAGIHIYQFEVRRLTSLYISLFSAISKIIVSVENHITQCYKFCFKHNLDNSRGEGKIIVFTHTFILQCFFFLPHVLGFLTVITPFLFRELPSAILLEKISWQQMFSLSLICMSWFLLHYWRIVSLEVYNPGLTSLSALENIMLLPQFLMRNSLPFNFFFHSGTWVLFLSLCFSIFFSVLGPHTCLGTVFFGLVWVYSASWICRLMPFCQIWGIFSHYFFLSPTLPFHSPTLQGHECWYLIIAPQGLWMEWEF